MSYRPPTPEAGEQYSDELVDLYHDITYFALQKLGIFPYDFFEATETHIYESETFDFADMPGTAVPITSVEISATSEWSADYTYKVGVTSLSLKSADGYEKLRLDTYFNPNDNSLTADAYLEEETMDNSHAHARTMLERVKRQLSPEQPTSGGHMLNKVFGMFGLDYRKVPDFGAFDQTGIEATFSVPHDESQIVPVSQVHIHLTYATEDTHAPARSYTWVEFRDVRGAEIMIVSASSLLDDIYLEDSFDTKHEAAEKEQATRLVNYLCYVIDSGQLSPTAVNDHLTPNQRQQLSKD